ncbi:MAG: hypothetical protein JWM86_8 [Thermoleophilia bacterium]|nr:hypothetical protein [Thermoleophilia bacterium]
MVRRVTIVLFVLAMALGATGCGGGSGDSDAERPLSKREYIDRANTLQAEAAKVFATLDGAAAPATPAAATTHLAALDRLIDGFGKLRPPRDWRDEHATLVGSLRTMRESMSTISRASASSAAIVQTQLARYRAAQRDFERAVRDINSSR